MSFLKVEDLKYRYPQSEELALDGISFELEKGTFLGILGENGAGKSTLCQALVGLVPSFYRGAYGGKVWVNGLEAAKTPVSELCRKAGLVFQNPFNQLSGAKETVFEEIAFGLQNFGVEPEQMKQKVEEVLHQLDIYEVRDKNPFELSGGQMQRVALASILVMEPELLILDEPTSQLDPRGSEEVFRTVELLAKSGITIVIVEQKMEKLAEYCDQILLMQKGKQIDFGTPSAVFSREDLHQYGVVPPAVTSFSRAAGLRDAEGNFPCCLEELTSEQREWIRDSYPEQKTVAGMDSTEWTENENKGDSQPMIVAKDLVFSYQSDLPPVLNGFSLMLDERTTAIIGQNGAGKTTLVKLLKGLLTPLSGELYYGTEPISGKSVAMLASKIGYVFQNPDDQIFKHRVLDEVMYGPLNIGMNPETARQKAQEAIALAGLTGLEEENPYDLNLSQRKMTAIASVLAMDTQVLILDEPTIAQDAEGKQRIARMIQTLRAEGRLVLSILHDMDFVSEYFERIIVMQQGRLLADGNRMEVFSRESLLEESHIGQPGMVKMFTALGYQNLYFEISEFLKLKEGVDK